MIRKVDMLGTFQIEIPPLLLAIEILPARDVVAGLRPCSKFGDLFRGQGTDSTSPQQQE